VNQPPVAALTASATSGVAPVTIAFDGSGSSDADGSLASYAWNFGDGATASGATASHTYITAGTFVATLTVTDNLGATSSTSTTITVTAPPTLPAPTYLSAKVSKGTVRLAWTDNSSNESGFSIERAPQGGTFTRIAQVGANVRTYSQPATKGTWVYRVQAFNATLTSAYSNTATVRVR